MLNMNCTRAMDKAMKTLSLIVILCVSAAISADQPKVKVYNGLLEGTYEQSYNGRTYSSFWGIPYAKPPVGELRFEVMSSHTHCNTNLEA